MVWGSLSCAVQELFRKRGSFSIMNEGVCRQSTLIRVIKMSNRNRSDHVAQLGTSVMDAGHARATANTWTLELDSEY